MYISMSSYAFHLSIHCLYYCIYFSFLICNSFLFLYFRYPIVYVFHLCSPFICLQTLQLFVFLSSFFSYFYSEYTMVYECHFISVIFLFPTFIQCIIWCMDVILHAVFPSLYCMHTTIYVCLIFMPSSIEI